MGAGDLVAAIEVNEMMGSEVHLHARSDADEVVMVIPTVDLKVDVSAGAKVKFTTQPRLIQLSLLRRLGPGHDDRSARLRTGHRAV